MKGDFSQWNFDKKDNFNGVLHQQGRVLTDNDWNAGTRMLNAWQEQKGRDVIGPGVAAVPAEVADSFKVKAAEFVSNQVKIEINPGRVWADGLLTYLAGEDNNPTAPVKRTATYLEPPFQDAAIDESRINTGIRDAVILEVWQEAVNGFQMPDQLIEPALSGPDTTERVHTAMAFRLLRLEEGETCADAADKLKENPQNKGSLIVTLAPPETGDSECPEEAAGGYTGFEHHLYRIEMARINDEVRTEKGSMFKWSRFNGGLVGRGTFSTSPEKVKITANFQAITTSGLDSFYLEAVEYNEELGHWNVTYGADATLNTDNNELDLTGTTYYGAIPLSDKPVFFRLWDGIKPIKDFPLSTTSTKPVILEDGIRLEFDNDAGKHYIPGDYWTFEVRAGEIKNKEILIDRPPPQGIRYHRVPLAILDWKPNEERVIISDCRRIFRSLIDQEGCCTFIVGKNGHFASIQKAIQHLPDSGGQICILPGIYEENVTIEGKQNIVITGCDKRTVIMPADQEGKPIFHIKDSQCITLEHMDMEAFDGTSVLMQASQTGQLKEIKVSNNRILACIHAVRVEDGQKIKIINNTIRMLDKEGGDVAIFILAEEGLIQGNNITVVPADEMPPGDNIPGDRPVPDPNDPCADLRFFVNFRPYLFYYFTYIWDFALELYPGKHFKTPGGIQIVGGSEKIKVLENEISGGAGNGITLGDKIEPVSSDSEEGNVKEETGLRNELAFIYDIQINGNEISDMGLSGIGTTWFIGRVSDPHPPQVFINPVDGLRIHQNHIFNCLQNPNHPEKNFEIRLESEELAQFEEEIEQRKERIGFGGISLGRCEDVSLFGNRIENNGINHIHPICGIYIRYVEYVDISHNQVVNNGPILNNTDAEMKNGKRGGISISAYPLYPHRPFVSGGELSFGKPAARVHDNVVDQPAGGALAISAHFGSLSILNNRFDSELSGPNPLASVMIFNLGSSIRAEYPESGNILFCNNQTQVGPDNNFLFSQYIKSTDGDIGFHGNQSFNMSHTINIAIGNTKIVGDTIRASGNRFKEIKEGEKKFSLHTKAKTLNNTVNNQGDNIIFVKSDSSQEVDFGNQ